MSYMCSNTDTAWPIRVTSMKGKENGIELDWYTSSPKMTSEDSEKSRQIHKKVHVMSLGSHTKETDRIEQSDY